MEFLLSFSSIIFLIAVPLNSELESIIYFPIYFMLQFIRHESAFLERGFLREKDPADASQRNKRMAC